MTNHIHQLDITCIRCVMDRCTERDILLKFLKEISDENINASDHILAQRFINYYREKSKKLIKEIKGEF